MKQHAILSANLKYLVDYSKNQFKYNTGLHLNSNEWKSHINIGPARYYSFLINGDLKFKTHSVISGETYEQIMKLTDYKKFESALLVLYLLNTNEETIIQFLKGCFANSNCRLFCPCKAYQYWGPHYNLTELKSHYGKGELRPPKVRDPEHNNLVCKHLWLVLTNFETEIDKFIKDLLPYYKRYFGINSPRGIERTQKELGEKGIRRIIGNALRQLLKINNDDLVNDYNKLVENKLNELFKEVSKVEKEDIEKTEQLSNEDKHEIEKQVEDIDNDIKEEMNNEEELNNEESTDNGTT